MPDVDSTLLLIAQWKHTIATDLTSVILPDSSLTQLHEILRSYHTIPRRTSICTLCHALEQLTSQVLGDLLKEGIVAKIADDLYCGGNSPGELLLNWKIVLQNDRQRNL